MTELLVILGLGALIAGLVFRKRVKPFLRWSVSSILFSISLVPLFALLILAVIAMLVLVAAIVAVTLLFCLLVFITLGGLALYLLAFVVTLIIWAVSRKRTAFDGLNGTVGTLADFVYRSIGFAFDKLEDTFDALDWALNRLEPLLAFTGKHGKVFAQPFVWVARKIWPNNR